MLAGDHLYGKLLFTWLSLVMSMMVSVCAVFFPRGVLDEILNFIESVSEGFPSYSSTDHFYCFSTTNPSHAKVFFFIKNRFVSRINF